MSSPNFNQKIGALFICGFAGSELQQAHPLRDHITRYGLGGVILFDRLIALKRQENNILSRAQLQTLTSELQELANGELLICVDQEGGKVSRFRQEFGFPTTPTAAELGKSADATYLAAEQTATMLADFGINCNLAPVVDVDIYPKNPIIGKFGRSFGSDPAVVSDRAKTWIDSHRCRNIVTCLKHFPGHGSSRADSHLGFVDITGSWQEQELSPYKTLLAANYADAVMVGHLCHRRLDPLYPATLSSTIIGGLLRQELGFDGVVITDDMQMRAITDRYGLGEACVLALAAGVDMIIIGNNLEHDPQLFVKIQKVVIDAVADGRLHAYRIEEAYDRVQQLKLSLRKKNL